MTEDMTATKLWDNNAVCYLSSDTMKLDVYNWLWSPSVCWFALRVSFRYDVWNLCCNEKNCCFVNVRWKVEELLTLAAIQLIHRFTLVLSDCIHNFSHVAAKQSDFSLSPTLSHFILWFCKLRSCILWGRTRLEGGGVSCILVRMICVLLCSHDLGHLLKICSNRLKVWTGQSLIQKERPTQSAILLTENLCWQRFGSNTQNEK